MIQNQYLGGNMKLFKETIIFLFTIALLINCNESKTIGAKDVHDITDVEFVITEKIVASSTKLRANGTVKNTGDNIIYPPWYIEGEFYTDSNCSFKLGGDYYNINFSLSPGEQTGWRLEFSSNLYSESDYPDFAIKNLRAYYED